MTPAFLAVELGMRSVAMLSASDGSDIGAKDITDVNLWDEEW